MVVTNGPNTCSFRTELALLINVPNFSHYSLVFFRSFFLSRSIMSRKRAPLVHRPSSTNTDSDIKSICRSLSLTKDRDEINSLLLRLFSSSTYSQEDLIIPILKLVSLKLQHSDSSDQRITTSLIGFLSSLPFDDSYRPELVRYLVVIVRSLVRSHPTGRVSWPTHRPLLLFIELCCWNCTRGSNHDQQVLIAKYLASLPVSTPFKDYVDFASSIIMGSACSNNRPIFQLLSQILAISEAKSLDEYVCDLKKVLIAGEHLSISDDVFERRARSILSLKIFLEIRWIAKIVHLLKPNQESCSFDSLTDLSSRLVPSICSTCDTFDAFFSKSENFGPKIDRQIMAEATYYALTNRSLSPIQRLVLGSNLLHYLKWTTSLTKRIQQSVTTGLLSPLISEDPEKLVESMMSQVSETKKIFLTVFAVLTVANAFAEIHYIPGQFWVLERAIEIFKNLPTGIGTQVAEFFRLQLRDAYWGSQTRIPDKKIEILLAGLKVEDWPGLTMMTVGETCNRQPLKHLGLLKKFVQNQYEYRHEKNGDEIVDHRLRLLRYLDTPVERKESRVGRPGHPRVRFSVCDGSLNLTITSSLTPIFSGRVCENFDRYYRSMIDRLESLMEANKQSVKSATDSAEFWESRKYMDKQLGKLLEEIESKIFQENENAKIILHEFVDGNSSNIIQLELPDILLSLPIECVPCLFGGTFVRVVDSLSDTESEESNSVHGDGMRKKFVVNPGADCSGSEEIIVPILGKNGWSGISGMAAGSLTDESFINLLKSSDIFIYSGHGGGEKHWSGSCIQRMRYTEGLGIALLMGCSSAKPYGDYSAPFCTPFHYLIGGYRLVVGTLWDVLGKELDRMTTSLVEEIAAKEKFSSTSDIVRMVSNSRKRAKLKFLTSASIVMYGVDIN